MPSSYLRVRDQLTSAFVIKEPPGALPSNLSVCHQVTSRCAIKLPLDASSINLRVRHQVTSRCVIKHFLGASSSNFRVCHQVTSGCVIKQAPGAASKSIWPWSAAMLLFRVSCRRFYCFIALVFWGGEMEFYSAAILSFDTHSRFQVSFIRFIQPFLPFDV